MQENKLTPEQIKEWTSRHSFPKEGWAIFGVGMNKNEVEKIDELGILYSDIEARELAKLRGYEFKNLAFPFEVTNFEEMDCLHGLTEHIRD